MDVQGHGTAHWEALERWALDELLKVVELRDGRHMDGPSQLELQDLVGKRLRVRYKGFERDAHDRGKRESGTFVFTITSIQVRDPRGSGPEIEFGIASHEVPLIAGVSVRYVAVRFIPQREPTPHMEMDRFVGFMSVTLHPPGPERRHELSEIRPINFHVLWD